MHKRKRARTRAHSNRFAFMEFAHMAWILMLLLMLLLLRLLLAFRKRDFPLTANAWANATNNHRFKSKQNRTKHTFDRRFGLSWFYYNLLEICIYCKQLEENRRNKKNEVANIETAFSTYFIAHTCMHCAQKSPFQGSPDEILSKSKLHKILCGTHTHTHRRHLEWC